MCGSMWRRIADQTRALKPSTTAKRILLFPFWLIGAIIGAAFAVLWQVYKWVAASIKVGLEDGTRGEAPRWDAQVAAQWALVLAVLVVGFLWVR